MLIERDVGWLEIAHLPLSAADRASIRADIEHVGTESTEILHRWNRVEKVDDGLPTGHRFAKEEDFKRHG
jgi:hypothetical protein